MDLVLTLTLIILHQVTSYLCKPLPELSVDKIIPNGNYATLTELLKDLDTQNLKNIQSQPPYSGQSNLGDRKNVLHMIQFVQKDANKAPIAIILTPADLATGIANKYKNMQDDRLVQLPGISEVQAIDSHTFSDEKAEDVKEIYEMKDSFKQTVTQEPVTFEISIPAEQLQSKVPQSNKPLINIDEVSKKEFKNNETSHKSKVPTVTKINGDDFNLLHVIENEKDLVVEESIQKDLSEEDFDANNYYENTENYHNQIYDYDDSKNDSILDNTEQNIDSQMFLKSQITKDNTNKYITLGNTYYNITSDNKLNQNESLVQSELIKQISIKESSDDKISFTQNTEDNNEKEEKRNNNADKSVVKIVTLNSLESETDKPISNIDVDYIGKVTNSCKKHRKYEKKARDTKPERRTYKLSFVFNR